MKAKHFMLVFFISLFSIQVSAQTTKVQRIITEKENGKTISIKKGNAFAVLFKNECIGCQYVWETSYLDSTFVKFTTSSYAGGPGGDMVGGSQDHTFHFKAVKRGRTKLSFVNGEKKFQVTIVVK